MTVRAVEGKLPYTGGKAIEITEDKVINLRLRDENNLIIWDEGDNEIYVDLQLPNEITPTDAFPVGITTGRVIIDNGWDSTGTLICAKTTSGDNIKVFYADDGKLYVDNGTGLFTQVYLKPEVDALLQQLRTYVDTELAKKQDKLIAGDNIEIASDGKTISAILPPLSRFLSLWDCSTGEPISFPASIPFEYETGDHYLVSTVDNTTNYRPDGTEWDGFASTTVETSVVAEGDMYIYDGIRWLLQHNQPGGGGSVISVNGQTGVVTLDADDISDSTTTNKFVTATDKTTWSGKQDALTLPATPTQGNLVTWGANNKSLVDGGAIPTGVPSGGTDGQVLSKVSGNIAWANPTGGSSTITVTLASANRSSKSITVTATGVTASNTVIVAPDPSSITDYTDAKIYCSAQGSNSLTFSCTDTPTGDIDVNVVIMN